VLHINLPRRTGAGAPTRRTGAPAEADAAQDAVERAFDDPERPQSVDMRVVEDASPVDAVLRVAGEFDLVVVGVSEEWGLESHLFGLRPERIAERCPTSLLIVRAHEDVAMSEVRHAAGPAPTATDRAGRPAAEGLPPT
jgi:nucleotide-binding universal stress UspA family protein